MTLEKRYIFTSLKLFLLLIWSMQGSWAFSQVPGRNIKHTLKMDGRGRGSWYVDALPRMSFVNTTTRYLVVGDEISLSVSSPDIWNVLYGSFRLPPVDYPEDRQRLDALSFAVTFIARKGTQEIARATRSGNVGRTWLPGDATSPDYDERLDRYVMTSQPFKVPLGTNNMAIIVDIEDSVTSTSNRVTVRDPQHVLDGEKLNLKMEATTFGPMDPSIAEEVNPVAGRPLTLNYDSWRMTALLKKWYPERDIALGIRADGTRIDGQVKGKIYYKIRFDDGPWSEEAELTRGHATEMPIMPDPSWYYAFNDKGFDQFVVPVTAKSMEIAFHFKPFMIAQYKTPPYKPHFADITDPFTNVTRHAIKFYQENEQVTFGEVWDTPDRTSNSGWHFDIQPPQ